MAAIYCYFMVQKKHLYTKALSINQMLISNINAINQAEIIVVKCLIQGHNKVA